MPDDSFHLAVISSDQSNCLVSKISHNSEKGPTEEPTMTLPSYNIGEPTVGKHVNSL